MKFLFLYPERNYSLHQEKNHPQYAFTPPLGLLYLSKILDETEHKVEVIDYTAEEFSKEKLKSSIISADAIGITVMTQMQYSLENQKNEAENAKATPNNLIREIRRIDSNIPVLIGGPHCSYYPKQSLLNLKADICVEGEAELNIIDVSEALQGRKNLSQINGVYYKENSEVKKGKDSKIVENLDSIPFPARHLVDKYRYGFYNNFFVSEGKVTSIITSRGCPYSCRFCCRNAPYMQGYRKRSPENVVKELEEISEKFDFVVVVDDNFLADPKRANKIADIIIKKEINLKLFVIGARVDSANRELYEKLKKIGVKYLEFGIESGNQDVLDFYNKKITLDQIRKAIKLSKEMNFVTIGNFILGAPIETKKHLKNTIKFACSLPLDVAYFDILGYRVGSDLWEEAVSQGKITRDQSFVLSDSNIGLGNFSTKELSKYIEKGYKKFYYRPSYLIKQLYTNRFRKK